MTALRPAFENRRALSIFPLEQFCQHRSFECFFVRRKRHTKASFCAVSGPTTPPETETGGVTFTSDTSTPDTIEIHVQPPKDNLTIPGSEKGGRKLAIVFTCTVCDTRSAKQFSERAYNHGVVIVRCPGCQRQHLIADRLGYFDDGTFDLDMIAAQTGHTLKKITDDGTVALNLEDLVGKKKFYELLQAASFHKQEAAAADDALPPTTSK